MVRTMTQIFTVFAMGAVYQLSDRLVVTPGPGKCYRPWDDGFNKSIVFRARDALVLIGFSGKAYIDELPTDAWVAWKLTGLYPEAATTIGVLPIRPDIYHAPEILRVELEAAFAPMSDNECGLLTLSAMGVQVWGPGRRRVRLVDWSVANSRRNPRVFTVRRGKSPRRPQARFMRVAFNPQPSDSRLAEVRAEMERGPGLSTEEEFQDRLLSAYKVLIEGRGDTVGSDYMFVRVSGRDPQVYVSYQRSDTKPGAGPFLPGLTPWLILGSLVQPPANCVGLPDFYSRKFHVHIDGAGQLRGWGGIVYEPRRPSPYRARNR